MDEVEFGLVDPFVFGVVDYELAIGRDAEIFLACIQGVLFGFVKVCPGFPYQAGWIALKSVPMMLELGCCVAAFSLVTHG